MVIRAFVFAGFVVFSPIAFTQQTEWVEIAASLTGVSYQMNTSRVERAGPSVVRAWIKTDARTAEPKQDYESAMTRYELDCASKMYRVLDVVRYDKNGEVVFTYAANDRGTMKSPTPESLAEGIMDEVCLLYPPKAKR